MSISKFRGDLEDAVDLAVGIAVGIGRRSHYASAPFQPLDYQLIGARIVQESLLRKDADLYIDSPFVLVDQGQNAFQAAEAHHRVDFQVGAHVGRAVEDAFSSVRLARS